MPTVSREVRELGALLAGRLERPCTSGLAFASIGVLQMAATVCVPILTGAIVEALARAAHGDGPPAGEAEPFYPLLLGLAAALISRTASRGLLEVVAGTLEARIGRRLRVDVASALLRTPGFGSDAQLGDATARVVSDCQHVQESVRVVFIQPSVDAIGLLVAASLMLAWSPAIGGLTLLTGPAALLLSRGLTRRHNANAARTQLGLGELAHAVQSWLGKASWVRAFAICDVAAERLGARAQALAELGVERARLRSWSALAGEVATAVPQLLILVLGGFMVSSNRLTVGDLVTLTSLSALVLPPMQRLALFANTILPGILPSARRLLEPLRQAPTGPDIAASTPVERLEVVNLRVEPQRDGGALVTVPRFAAHRAELVCLRGQNGSGKTSFCAALAGLLEFEGEAVVTSATGSRALGGNDVAFSAAEPIMFEGSLEENVLLFRSATPATAPLLRWAEGCEGGEPLALRPDSRPSRGELQRIAVARALCQGRAVRLLDEPSNGLDDDAVAALIGHLRHSASHGPTIVVTHDERLMRASDRVYETVRDRAGWEIRPALEARSEARLGRSFPSPAEKGEGDELACPVR